MSTTLLIGRMPAAVNRALSHSGEGPIVTPSYSRAVKRGQSSRSWTSMLTPGTSPGRARVVAPWRRLERRAGGRVGLARDSVDAEAVRPVRGDLELEHLAGDRQHLDQRRARSQLGVEHHDPVVVGADRDLVLGQDHPRGLDAAQLRPSQLRAVGHHGARLGHRDDLAGGHVRRPAHDRALVAGPDVDRADGQPVGVRVAFGAEHAADEEVLERAHPMPVDGLDLRPAHREQVLELGDADARVAVVVQPEERDPHPNCSRKRRSLS